MQKTYTFEMMPQVLAEIQEKLTAIESRLASTPVELVDDILSIDQASELLKLQRQTLYGYVQRKAIPFSKIQKRLYFSRRELTNWVLNSKTEIIGNKKLKG